MDIRESFFSLLGSGNPSPKTTDTRSRQPFGYNEDEDTERIEKEDIDDYWQIYETNPIVYESINAFASRVVEDGYYLEGGAEDLVDEVGDWLENSAILEGEFNQSFNKFLKKCVIQEEVKGTVLIEKVKDESGETLAAFKFIPIEGLEIHTKPNQSLLVPPEPNDDIDYEAPETNDGKLAAYEQVNDMQHFTSQTEVVLFTRDEVIKLARNADVGEVKGTSRIEPIKERANGLQRKLQDNDEAIASKAYPLWLFKFGTEENPWDSDQIDEFMKSHEVENFHPGMKQGVYGDIDVETISGEVAEISEYLQFDIDFIMAAMPMPKYTVGFEQSINQFVSNQQQMNLRRQIRERRNELEDEFTPAIREKAKDMGYSEEAVNDLNLRIGKPDEEDIEEENINVIRYLGVDKDQRGSGEKEDEGKQNGQNSSESPQNSSEDEEMSFLGNTVNSFNLSSEYTQKLSEAIEKEVLNARDDFVDSFKRDVDRRVTYSDTSSRVVRKYKDSEKVKRVANDAVDEAIEEAISGSPDSKFGNPTSSKNKRNYIRNIVISYNDIIEDLSDNIRTQIRRGAERNEEKSTIAERIETKFNRNKVTQRANIASHMEIQNIINTVKLQQFEYNSDVVGYRFVNENPSTKFSKRVNGVEVYFNDNSSYVNQIEQQVSNEIMRKGFDPMPSVPPLKYRDTTTIEPIME